MKTLPLLVLLCGCASAPAPERSAASIQDCATGEVANFGVDRQSDPVLRTPEGRVRIGGPMASTILALTGATVTICGDRDGDSLVVRTFEFRGVEGLAGYLGFLRTEGEGYALDPGNDRPLVSLTDVPPHLMAEVSQEVWVTGNWVEGRFAVKSFGVLRR